MLFVQKISSTFIINMSVFQLLLFLNIYLVVFGVQADVVGDNCQLESTRAPGQCTLLKECTAALDEIRESRLPQVCGFQGKEPIVCCVRTTSTPAEVPSQQDKTERISRKKCKEYGQATSEVIDFPSLINDMKPIRQEVCSKVVNTLIVGGATALPKQFPHMALLGYGPQDDIKWMCGGSLISEQFVLTVAHCMVTPKYGEVSWIRLGDLNISSTTDDAQPQDFRVAERIAHPEFKRPSIYNDIALLKLNRAVTFTEYIAPACLYTGAPALRPEQRFFATSWSSWKPFLASSIYLQKLILDQISQGQCNASYGGHNSRRIKFGILPESQLCAGGTSKDLCQDSSGGPLQIFSEVRCMYDIVGVTSFGNGCANPSVPGLYTRVSHYLDWIERIVWP